MNLERTQKLVNNIIIPIISLLTGIIGIATGCVVWFKK